MILSEKFEKMSELDESSDRAYLIDQIRALGKNYDFSHFTTQQLWNILNKLQKQNDDNLDMYNDAMDALNKSEKPVCDKCGMELNDNGECPLCDLNDESSLEESKSANVGEFGEALDKALEDNNKSIKYNVLGEKIEKHDILNPALWNDKEELKSKVKEKLLKVVDKFEESLKEDGLDIKVKDIVIIGSNASYNYTSNSDIDVHIIADTSEMEDPLNVLPIVYNAYKSLFNDKHDVMINDHEIEVYVEINAVNAKSNGIYSLNTGWIKKPDINSIPDIDEDAFDKLFTQWEDRYFSIVKMDENSNNSSDEMNEIDSLINDIYKLRQDSIANEGEYGLGNLVFKEFRNLGYLDNLKDIKTKLEDKEMSISQ